MSILKSIMAFLQALPKLVGLIEQLKEERIRREVQRRVKQINRDLAKLKNAKTDEERKEFLKNMSKWD